jgi:hypothetical protein
VSTLGVGADDGLRRSRRQRSTRADGQAAPKRSPADIDANWIQVPLSGVLVGGGWSGLAERAARHPVCGTVDAITLRVRHLAVKRELVAGTQVSNIVPHGEPHFTVDDKRP